MKTLAICGSPRKGNTEAMLAEVLRGAKMAGMETELVLLRELDIKHCDGCLSCEKTHECKIHDEMQDFYLKMFNSDVLILGSPNYFDNVSGLMKDFIDRMAPYWDDKRFMGKTVAIVAASNEKVGQELGCVKALKEFCDICDLVVAGTVDVLAHDPQEVLKNKNVMNKCFELGKRLQHTKA